MVALFTLLAAACGPAANAPAATDAAAATRTELTSEPAPPVEPAAPAAGKTAVEEEYRALALKNPCPNGYQALQGLWTFSGKSKTPGLTNTLAIDGTSYRESIHGRPDGKETNAVIEGEVRCLFRNRILIMIDKVTPEGAFGNRSGDTYPCDVLQGMKGATQGQVLLSCFFDWDLRVSAGKEFEYKRVAR